MVAAVVTVAAATGGEERYEQFVERFREADTPQDQLRYLYALADFDDEDADDAHARLPPRP